jgi:hypothetical protein
MAKTGRNDLCPCGSGKKYKKCHEPLERGGTAKGRMLAIVVGAAVLAAVAAGIASFTGEPTSTATRVWDPVHGHYHDANGVAVP